MKNINQYQISTIGLLAFTSLIVVAALYTELFRPQLESELKNTQLLTNPIRKDILLNLEKIEFKNYNNVFKLVKNQSKWELVSPVKMKSSIDQVESIINALKGIEVQTILKKNKLNLQNFSLNNPLMTITITSKLKEVQTINFGILNSIDDSSYLSVSNVKAIYQTNIVSSQLLKYKLSDFIDASIFPEDLERHKKLEIISARDNRTLHILEKVNGTWISNKYKQISDNSVNKKISQILNINAKVIVDDVDEKTLQFLNNYIENPKLRINFRTDKLRQFIVTYPITKNDSLKIEKNENFIIKDITENTIYLVDKSYLSEFNIRYSDVK